MNRIGHLIRKEFLELRQDPRLFGIVIMAPLIQLTMLGYAATTDVRDVPIVVVDQDRSTASRELVSRFEASENFVVADTLSSVDEIDAYLDSGRAWLALAIPPDYGRHVRTGRPVAVQVVADGTDANSTNVALGYAGALMLTYARELAAASGRARAEPLVGADIRVWFNPTLESRHFMIPGILALLLLVVCATLSSMAIVREKELGTLEQLNVTPLARWELIVGKLVPYAMIGMLDVFLVVGVAVAWFEVPLRGSFALLLLMCLVYLLTALGLGLFVSTISRTQQQAMMTTSFFFFLPMVFLSGFIFPIENMPQWIQPITYLIPLRYFLVILRGIFLKGIGLEVFWRDGLALLAWGLGILTLATLRSTKRLA
ncbi:MAG: ABC transporter permease [Acidobacteria bacterium]|nr:ABC transporter permease [Acidobacteriota bacterium]